MVMFEATAVAPEGRITPYCAGLWQDEHIPMMKRIVDFIHGQQSFAGIQLAHAGRKASTLPPFQVFKADSKNKTVASESEGGWPLQVVGPTTEPFTEDFSTPVALSKEDLRGLVKNFAAAGVRAREAGFDAVEVHAAHGYLLSTFLSPASNTRTDKYGGSLENRMRLLVEVVQALRQDSVWPKPLVLSVRLSCSDWVEGGQPLCT